MKRMRGKKVWLFALFAVLLCGVGGWILWNQFFRVEEEPVEDEFYYTTHTLYEQDPISVKGKAQLQIDDAYYVKSDEGTVDTVYVEDGQAVEKGDTLYTIRLTGKDAVKAVADLEREQTKLYNRRERLQADYQKAQVAQQNTQSTGEGEDVGNEGEPSASGLDPFTISQELAEVNEQIADMDQQVTQARNDLYQVVTAKNGGQVHLNEAGRNDSAKAFIRVISPGTFVSGSVDEYDFFALKEGLAIQLHIPAQERDVKGKIVNFDPLPEIGQGPVGDSGDQETDFSVAGAEASGQFGFVAEPEEFIQPGFTVEMLIPLSGIAIPKNAVIEEADQAYVFVLEDGKAKKVALQAERQGKKWVTQPEDLPIGTILILDGYDLEDGQTVKTDLDQALDGEFLDPMSDESVGG